MITMDGGRLLDNYLKEESSGSTKINLSKMFTKVLWCLIFFLGSLIFTSVSDENLVMYKKYVFEDNFNFAGFKNLYAKISSTSKDSSPKEQMVFGSSLEYTNVESYQGGQKFTIDTDVPINVLSGGIVVFSGVKEGFNNTIIIQGSDGYDIWYGNLDNIDVQIYDYVDANEVIASASDSLYLLITKDSQYFTYEEYQNQI